MKNSQPETPAEKPQSEDLSLLENLLQSDVEQKQAILHTQQVLYGVMEHLGMIQKKPKPFCPLTPEQVKERILLLRNQTHSQGQGEGQFGSAKPQPLQPK